MRLPSRRQTRILQKRVFCSRCSFDYHCTRQDDASDRWGVEHNLTAILCADVYGYSRLMGGDEEATLVT